MKRYVVVLMEYDGSFENGDPDDYMTYDTIEEARACDDGASMMNNTGCNFIRIWDRESDQLIDDLALDDYDEEENKHSDRTLKDLKKIKEFIKIK